MLNNLIVKIKREDGQVFVIDRTGEWRFHGKKPLEGFGDFGTSIDIVQNGVGDGAVINGTRTKEVDRTINFCYLNPALNENARKKVTSFFATKQKYKVYVTYSNRTRWAEGLIEKSSISTDPDEGKILKCAVTFLFPTQYWKSADDFGANIAEVEGMIGFPYMVSNDVNPAGLTGGKFNFARKVNLPNDGDVPSFCTAVFTASGIVKNPKLILQGHYVRLIDTLESGDILSMDFTASPPTVKKNGINWIGHCDRTSAFSEMILNVGDNVISYDADDGTEYLSVYIYYNKLYGVI